MPTCCTRWRAVLRRLAGAAGVLSAALAIPAAAHAQYSETFASVAGRVRDATNGAPVPGVVVSVEGTALRALSDSSGQYRLTRVPPGPQVLHARRLGFAVSRVAITVPATGTLERDLEIATVPLRLSDVVVTADIAGRARGELGTASVIDREAIANLSATSLAGILELVPGTVLKPPGLDGVQQATLRSVPVSSGGYTTQGDRSAGDIASLGTQIVLDGVPLSNNANLQSSGPRGELLIASSAGGGIDLRRLPAATLDRVEVIRGIPSTRFGDLTTGVIVVDTRAGAFRPVAQAHYDLRTVDVSLLGGWGLGRSHLLSSTADVAQSRLAPGLLPDAVTRYTLQVAHRWTPGHDIPNVDDARLVLDTRVDAYRLEQDSPEQPDFLPGRASWNHDNGLRISERAKLRTSAAGRLTVTAALDRTRQNSYSQSELVRSALPFTDRLTEGRTVGRYIGGPYIARLRIDGVPWLLYGRVEHEIPLRRFGFDHALRTGAEARREWNAGPGYQFDIATPPQATFNGVQGFDRPRRYDAVPPVATSSYYVDDRLVRTFAVGGREMALELQAGLRADVLHQGRWWLSKPRDTALQPRFNAQLSPVPWLRLRAGAGRTAKQPTIADLYPASQYFDVINVNWYTPDPAERLAVLSTFVRDPVNAGLGFSVADKREVGIELVPGRSGFSLQLVAYRDRTKGAIGIHGEPGSLLREFYQLSDSTVGTGRPPTIIEPASSADSVPILVQRPANNQELLSRGLEMTLALPEIAAWNTRLEIQGSTSRSTLYKNDLDFGFSFPAFQTDQRKARSPYWTSATRDGRLDLLTYRLIHHQPRLGLVITTTVQQTLKEQTRDIGGNDSTSFAGYITRSGTIVPVPEAERAQVQYRDLFVPRTGIFVTTAGLPPDWLLSTQVSKTLPLDGRLSFYAFNALDRLGRFSRSGFDRRQYPGARFGLELSMPFGTSGAR